MSAISMISSDAGSAIYAEASSCRQENGTWMQSPKAVIKLRTGWNDILQLFSTHNIPLLFTPFLQTWMVLSYEALCMYVCRAISLGTNGWTKKHKFLHVDRDSMPIFNKIVNVFDHFLHQRFELSKLGNSCVNIDICSSLSRHVGL